MMTYRFRKNLFRYIFSLSYIMKRMCALALLWGRNSIMNAQGLNLSRKVLLYKGFGLYNTLTFLCMTITIWLFLEDMYFLLNNAYMALVNFVIDIKEFTEEDYYDDSELDEDDNDNES